jgi:FMN phosphatase YigB (HAD superfamily)
MGKPAAAAFQLPARELGLSLTQMAMVGDDPDTDLAGARAVGMQTIFIRTSAVPGRRSVAADEYDTALDSFADLPRFLKGHSH